MQRKNGQNGAIKWGSFLSEFYLCNKTEMSYIKTISTILVTSLLRIIMGPSTLFTTIFNFSNCRSSCIYNLHPLITYSWNLQHASHIHIIVKIKFNISKHDIIAANDSKSQHFRLLFSYFVMLFQCTTNTKSAVSIPSASQYRGNEHPFRIRLYSMKRLVLFIFIYEC